MTKNVKEIYQDRTSGQVTIEYDDDSIYTYNIKDTVTTVIDSATGGIINSASPLGLYITNPSALFPVAVELRKAVASEFFINGTGDSLFQLGGDTSNLSSDVMAEKYGFLARLRQKLNLALGTPDGGQWIPAQASPADTRVENTGCTAVNQYGPYNGYRNSSGTIVSRLAMAIKVSGDNITFTSYGRYFSVEVWENAGNGYNGTIAVSIDGGAASNLAGTGLTDTYRTLRIDAGSIGNHTVSLSWVSGYTMVTGCTVTMGSGVATRRFGYGGSKASQWAALQEKQQRTSFKTQSAALHIIRFSYNDWSNQVGDGLTIAAFKGYISTLIALAQANPGNKAVLLVSDPPASTADNKPIKYADFAQALKDLATGSVAYFDVASAVNTTWNTGNPAGLYVDFVHRTEAGYDAEASVLANALLDPCLLKMR